MRRALALALAGAVATSCRAVRTAAAQAVVQLEGGGNTITGGYGSRLQWWSGDFEGWIGAGYSRGWRMGFFGKHPIGMDTLRGGFDVQPIGLSTDLFSSGSYMLTQGLAWRHKRDKLDFTLFGGATGDGAGAPFVNTSRADKPLGMLSVDYRPNPSFFFASRAVAARRQTFLESANWTSDDNAHNVAATAGIGSNHPYGAVSWHATHEFYDLRVGYSDFKPGFRRADAPLPNIAEPYRENVLLTLRLPKRAMLTLGHQNYRQDDSVTFAATLASVDHATASLNILGFTLGTGVFQSTTQSVRSISTFNSVSRPLILGATGSAMYFQTFHPGYTPIRTLQAEVREPITRTLSLTELYAQTGKTIAGGLGGRYQKGFTTIALDYQNYYVPLREPNPFMRALTLTIRLAIGNATADIGTVVDPFGRVTYTAAGSTYLYLGDMASGIQPISLDLNGNVIRGTVKDENGAPVDGAALDFGGVLTTTDSRGEFFVRTKSRRAMPLRVAFDDFLAVGNYELVSAPPTVTPVDESHAEPVRIVLRNVIAPQAQSPSIPPGAVRPQTASSSWSRGTGAGDAAGAVPLPSAAMLTMSVAGSQCLGTSTMLRQLYLDAADVAASEHGDIPQKDGWRVILRPLPIKPF